MFIFSFAAFHFKTIHKLQLSITIFVVGMEWPDGDDALSCEAMQAIDQLLTQDPNLRPAGAEVRSMPLFNHIDWDNLLNTVPPFVPNPDDLHDTSYFQGMYSKNFQPRKKTLRNVA